MKKFNPSRDFGLMNEGIRDHRFTRHSKPWLSVVVIKTEVHYVNITRKKLIWGCNGNKVAISPRYNTLHPAIKLQVLL